MSNENTVAKKYARAFFETFEIVELDAQRDALNQWVTTWADSAELREALCSPVRSVKDKVAVARDISEAISSGNTKLSNLIALLIENGRISTLSQVAKTFSTIVDSVHKALEVEVTSAFELESSERSDIEARIKGEFGDKARINWSVEADILGGLVIRCGDKMLDSSVKGSLESIRHSLL